jgi:hypothetical protein
LSLTVQESQKKTILEREKEKEEENNFDEDEERMIKHFKKIAQGIKGEGRKYN